LTPIHKKEKAMLTIDAISPPIQSDPLGVLRIGASRVRLDSVIYAFDEGNTAEEIVSQFPTISLVDVYAVLAWYLNDRPVVAVYLAEQKAAADELRRDIESRPEQRTFRAQLLARRVEQQKAAAIVQ